MSQVTFAILAELPIVEKFQKAFRRATGVVLKLVPAGTPSERCAFGGRQSAFCGMLAGNLAAAEACWRSEAEIQRRAGKTLSAQTARCFAGMEVVAVPVIVEGRHLATWIGGQVLSRKPTRADFKEVAKQLAKWGVQDELHHIEAAFLGSRVVPADQFQAMKQLLTLFAQHLGEYADRLWAVPHAVEPPSVTRAKEFIQAHFTEPVSLGRIREFLVNGGG